MNSLDETIMQKCIELASKGLGWASPNPLVGSVLVNNNEIISEGFHEYFGGPHAEANCLLNLSDPAKAKGATLYVNLEPCTHFGKTPPCTDLIKTYGIKKVVIGSLDPNPEVSGGGMKKLQMQGIEVQVGVLKNECDFLNKRFFRRVLEKRPYIILKWAESLDGFIAPADRSRMQMSCEESIKLLHQWRSEEAAIMVGSTTVISDNPKLTNRSGFGKNPIRVIVDRRNRLEGGSFEVFNDAARTIVFGHHDSQTNHTVFSSKDKLREIFSELAIRFQVDSVLVEGGSELFLSLIKENLWDEFRVFKTAKKLGDGIPAPGIAINKYESNNQKIVGEDTLVTVAR